MEQHILYMLGVIKYVAGGFRNVGDIFYNDYRLGIFGQLRDSIHRTYGIFSFKAFSVPHDNWATVVVLQFGRELPASESAIIRRQYL